MFAKVRMLVNKLNSLSIYFLKEKMVTRKSSMNGGSMIKESKKMIATKLVTLEYYLLKSMIKAMGETINAFFPLQMCL